MAISAVAGMGGVGKTELAIRYAREYEAEYPGGICWLDVREKNLAAEIVQFYNKHLGEVPQELGGEFLDLQQQAQWCWSNWYTSPPALLAEKKLKDDLVLVILDDVTDLENLQNVLPTANRFRLLITTRLRNLDPGIIEEVSLDVLSAEQALELLTNLVSEGRVKKERQEAEKLCERLGYLPLGLQLVGVYLARKHNLSLAEMLQRLEEKRLEDEALDHKYSSLNQAQLGVKAAFELSWQELELYPMTQRVGEFLSLFAAGNIDWKYVESASQSLNWQDCEIETANEQLYQHNLIQQVLEGEPVYKIHPLIREFLRLKLKESPQQENCKQAFAATLVEIAKKIPDSPTLDDIAKVQNAIPHLAEVAENLIDAVEKEDLFWVFTRLSSFYQGQGLYALAEPWRVKCLATVKDRLGEEHLYVAASLQYLALLYRSTGRYDEAEPLLQQALELAKRLLGEHPHVAASLNNLALLYHSTGRYDEAEPLLLQALELAKRLLGEKHPNVATSLNNLAGLYCSTGRYHQAEGLYLHALELRKRLLGEHPAFALSLNNLAELYRSTGRYHQAEGLYLQALELRKRLLGEEHPDVAASLSNLALLYHSTGRYHQAEPLFLQALALRKRLLGEHPDVAQSLNNLAGLYNSTGRYHQAEPLFLQALEICQRVLRENHPLTLTVRENLEILLAEKQQRSENDS